MNFIKRNKKLLVVIVIFLVSLVGAIQLKNILFPSGGAIYGNRLEGIEEVEISKDLDKQVLELLKDGIMKADVRISGRIVNIHITVNGDVSVATAKSYADKTLTLFAEKQLKYYDIQVFMKKDVESKEFPIIGYKHQDKSGFTWTKDRA